MTHSASAVYLSTILLEKNRLNGKGPTLLVSDWMEETGEVGFAGLDVWFNHLQFSIRSEWELIKERSSEFNLPIGLISTILPTDASDKSQRIRETIAEACDFFNPEGLKYTFAPTGATASAGVIKESFEFVKEWSRDISKETAFIFDPGSESKTENLVVAREVLGGGRFQAALHPFILSPSELEKALKEGGDFIANLCVQAKTKDQWILLEDNAAAHQKIVKMVLGLGYTGTWSLEATEGSGRLGEEIETMADNAEKDLNFLIAAQTRGVKENRRA